jgi:hypothetical protein
MLIFEGNSATCKVCGREYSTSDDMLNNTTGCPSDDCPSNTDPSMIIAALIRDAAAMREASYNKVASDAVDPGTAWLQEVDYTQFYTVSIYSACTTVCTNKKQKVFIDLINALLVGSWNESLDWSKEVLGGNHE